MLGTIHFWIGVASGFVCIIVGALISQWISGHEDIEIHGVIGVPEPQIVPSVLIAKEQRITALKYEVQDLCTLVELKDLELNDLEEKYQLAMVAANAFQANAEAKTPEWYKAALLEKIAQVRNLEMLNPLLEDANSLYSADIKQLQQERDTLANKIDKLREDYTAYRDEAISMPDIMPIAGQTGVIIDEKPMAEPYESEINDGQASPADEHDVAVGC